MRGQVHILVYCPIDTLQWGSTHSAMSYRPSLLRRTSGTCPCTFVVSQLFSFEDLQQDHFVHTNIRHVLCFCGHLRKPYRLSCSHKGCNRSWDSHVRLSHVLEAFLCCCICNHIGCTLDDWYRGLPSNVFLAGFHLWLCSCTIDKYTSSPHAKTWCAWSSAKTLWYDRFKGHNSNS